MGLLRKIFNKRAPQANFSLNKVRLPQHSKFDVPFQHFTTMKEGKLVPLYWDYTIPGDVLSMESTGVIRFNDLLRPFVDQLDFEMFWFFVPFRLLWEHWNNFFGELGYPGDTRTWTVPEVTFTNAVNRSYLEPQGLVNYFTGLDTNQLRQGGAESVGGITLPAFLFRAYNMIVNEWFMPREIVAPCPVRKGDGPDNPTDYPGKCWNIYKKPDYFTTALPEPQRGAPVSLPLAGDALTVDVFGDGKALTLDGGRRSGGGYPVLGKLGYDDWDNEAAVEVYNRGTYGNPGIEGMYSIGTLTPEQYATAYPQLLVSQGAGKVGVPTKAVINKYNESATYPITSGLTGEVDLSAATSITIQQFRELVAINHILEVDARYGMRYTELLMSHFGVSNGDLSLQRPQFLGKSKTHITLTQVPQTSASTNASPQANLTAYSMSGVRGGFSRTSFGECGVVMGLAAFRVQPRYQQGLNRHLFKRTRFDFFWPEFQNISDQVVYQGEIYYTGVADEDNKVFGWQTRYSEYKYKPSITSGFVNSMASLPMDQWHLGQKFTSAPKLNYNFMIEDAPIDRVRAVNDENLNAPFLVDMQFVAHWMRPMTLNTIPGLSKI